MKRYLLMICVLLFVCDKSLSQDTSVIKKINCKVVALIAKEFKDGNIILSEMCFKNVRNYINIHLLDEFFSDTSYVMSNFMASNTVDSCFCDYYLYSARALGNAKNKKEYSLFLSPYFENTIIARVAKKSSVVFYDNQFSATGTNYFYLIKFSRDGTMIKYRKQLLKID